MTKMYLCLFVTEIIKNLHIYFLDGWEGNAN